MKKLFALALVLAAFVPVIAAQTRTTGSFTGKWQGTFTRQAADGTDTAPQPIVFDLTQTGKHAGQELRSAGTGETWIASLGSQAEDGDFRSFIERCKRFAPMVEDGSAQANIDAEAVRFGKSPTIDIDDAQASVAVVDAAYRSMQTGAWVRVVEERRAQPRW